MFHSFSARSFCATQIYVQAFRYSGWHTFSAMKLLTIFRNFFSPSNKVSSTDQTRLKGYQAYMAGKKYYLVQNYEDAVACFDTAVDCGFSVAELFASRGTCSDALGWKLDAIDDYNEAITLSSLPDCNLYFQRGMAKVSSGDLQGCLADIREAVRLAKIPNTLTQNYDDGAREMGHASAAALYELYLVTLPLQESPDFESAQRERAMSKGRRPRTSDRIAEL